MGNYPVITSPYLRAPSNAKLYFVSVLQNHNDEIRDKNQRYTNIQMAHAPGYSNMVICPYNKCPILMERFQKHLVKCKKNYPGIVLKKCPFNTTHHIAESEFDRHVEQCDDRCNFDLYRFPIAPVAQTELQTRQPAPEPVYHPMPESEENWDDDNHHEAYNPQAYAENAPVIRQMNVASRSERRAFRESERRRLNQLRQQNP